MALTLCAVAGAELVPEPAFAAPSASAAAASSSDTLWLQPANQAGGYILLEMAPGETEVVSVTRGNTGKQPVDTRTYLANVYTIVNGGFGASLSGSAPSGTTLWASYATELLHLAPGSRSRGDITVSVPAATAPGDYLTSVVLEDTKPSTGAGAVQVKQVVRHALAVAVHVHGKYEPAFTIGSVTHQSVDGRSVVNIGLTNTGNQNLRPAGKFVIHDARRTEIAQATSSMESVYAHNATTIRSTFSNGLQPGKYTLTITMTDQKTGVTQTATDLPFTVADPSPTSQFDNGVVRLPEILQGATVNPFLLIGAGAVIALIIGVGVHLLRRRRRLRVVTRAAKSSSTDS